MMERAFVLHIRPSKVDEYVAIHENPWPEMVSAIKDAGFTKCSLFLDGSTVFGLLEASDIDASWVRLEESEVAQRWWALTTTMHVQLIAQDGVGNLRPIFSL